MGLYRSLTAISGDGVGSYEGPALCGYKCGNRQQKGCLTSDQGVRLHSCERGTECSGIKSENVVWITPIITRTITGVDVPELGAGGGGGDLDQHHELELSDTAAVGRLINLCSDNIQDPHLLAKIISILSRAMTSEISSLTFDGKFAKQDEEGNITLQDLLQALTRIAGDKSNAQRLPTSLRSQAEDVQMSTVPPTAQLPRTIVSAYTSSAGSFLTVTASGFHILGTRLTTNSVTS